MPKEIFLTRALRVNKLRKKKKKVQWRKDNFVCFSRSLIARSEIFNVYKLLDFNLYLSFNTNKY